MSQAYVMPLASTDFLNQAMVTGIPNAFEALRTCFSGATEPGPKVAYQLWADTTIGYMKIRDAANTTWIKLFPITVSATHPLSLDTLIASLSATTTTKVAIVPRVGIVKRLILLAETASVSSSGIEWQPMLKNYPTSAPGSPVNLFSGTVGTFTALGGVGGGVEHVANQALVYTPNQNTVVAALDVLEVVITKVGAATTLTNWRAIVDME